MYTLIQDRASFIEYFSFKYDGPIHGKTCYIPNLLNIEEDDSI